MTDATPAHDPPDLIDTAVDAGHPFDRRLLAVCVAGFCVFLSVYATQSLLPLLRQMYHTTEVWAAMTITAVTAAVAITAPWIGLLSERVGRKNVIVGAIALLTVPLLGAATAHSLGGLIAWRFAQGLVMPGIIAVTMAYVSAEWPPRHVGSAMSAYITGNVLGGVTGRMMAGFVGEHYGWPRVFVVLGCINAAGGVTIFLLLPAARRATPPPLADALAAMGRHFLNGRLLSSFFVGAALLFALIATLNYIAYHLADPPFNLQPTQIGLLFLVYLVGVVVTPIGGRFIDRRGQRFALVTAVCTSMCGVALALVPSVPVAVPRPGRLLLRHLRRPGRHGQPDGPVRRDGEGVRRRPVRHVLLRRRGRRVVRPGLADLVPPGHPRRPLAGDGGADPGRVRLGRRRRRRGVAGAVQTIEPRMSSAARPVATAGGPVRSARPRPGLRASTV